MKLGAKIYYLLNSGEVVYTIEDRMGFVRKTTKEQDWENILEINKYKIESLDFIELEHGELEELLFNNKANTYAVNLESKELIFKYIDFKTGEETEAPESEFKKEVSEIESVKEELTERIDTLSDAMFDLTIYGLDGFEEDLEEEF